MELLIADDWAAEVEIALEAIIAAGLELYLAKEGDVRAFGSDVDDAAR